VRNPRLQNAAPLFSMFFISLFTSPVAFVSGIVGGRIAGGSHWTEGQREPGFVPLTVAGSVEEAAIIVSLLRAEGIPSSHGGVSVAVQRNRLVDARELIGHRNA